MLSRLLSRLLGLLLLAALLLPAPVAADTPVLDPDAPGANDWTCRPTAERPVPVVLVHGTFGDRSYGWEPLSRALSEGGWCVYSLEHGQDGTQDMALSALEVAAFVQRVRRSTGAARVSLVGHSQGGVLARYVVARLRQDGRSFRRLVDDVVSLAAPHHGSAYPFLSWGVSCPACRQQAAGSAFLADLNRGDETPGRRVSWTSLTTRLDAVVVPHTSGHLAPGPRTTNLVVQDLCPLDPAEHVLLPSSPTAVAVTLDALRRRGPAREGAIGC